MLFRLNSSLIILGARPYFTFYINTAISCSLWFSCEGSSARTKRFSHDSEWELNTALSARFWIRSIFLLSEDLQLCHKIYAIPDCNMLSEAGWIACEQALLFGRVKPVSRERASERRSREGRSCEARFACPNRRACSQATGWMICRLSVLLCMVSNFAVSIRHQLFADWPLCKCYWYGWWN